MVKRLLIALLSTHIRAGISAPSKKDTLELPEHPDAAIELKRTDRKASVAFRVHNNKIRVTAPKRLALYRIQQLLHKRSKWIGRQLEYQASLPQEIEKRYGDGVRVPYLGRRYRLNITTSAGRARPAQLRAGRIEIKLPSHQQEDQQAIKGALEGWYQQRAEAHIPKIVAQLSEQIGVNYGAIEIRHFKSRWGSCRADGRLQFNWRLMMANPEVLRYVIVHELCHRIHLNHSRPFWHEVERQIPDFRHHQRWLKTDGQRLTL